MKNNDSYAFSKIEMQAMVLIAMACIMFMLFIIGMTLASVGKQQLILDAMLKQQCQINRGPDHESK